MAFNTILGTSISGWINDWIKLIPDDLSLGNAVASLLQLVSLPDHVFALIIIGISTLLFFSKNKNVKGAASTEIPVLQDDAAPETEQKKRAYVSLMIWLASWIADIFKEMLLYLGEKLHDPKKPIPEGTSPETVYLEDSSNFLYVCTCIYWFGAMLLGFFLPLNNVKLLGIFALLFIGLLLLFVVDHVCSENYVGRIWNVFKRIFGIQKQAQPEEQQPPATQMSESGESPVDQNTPVGGKEQP